MRSAFGNGCPEFPEPNHDCAPHLIASFRVADATNSGVPSPADKHWDGRVGNNLLRLAADQDGGNPTPAM